MHERHVGHACGSLPKGHFFAAIGAACVPVLVGLFLALLGCTRACGGSVGVVLNESLDESMDRITGTGHTAVYFSNICADSPVKLRLCRPGELGSVMSVYINIGEDEPYGWNIAPLSVYLYGVEDPRNRPIFGSTQVKRVLEDRYRENYLSEYCASEACRTSPKAEWREMVAATLIRTVYIFAVDSTEEQDLALIAEFNDAVNKNHFNGVTRNCADFTRNILNTYFPHAVKRDYINDFGMTSPKAVARTFTRYALRHPELNFRVLHFAQVPGTIKRSSEVRAGTEQLYRSKKLLIPMIIFAGHELPVVAGAYLLTGRFNPEKTFEKNAGVEAEAGGDAGAEGSTMIAARMAAGPEERQRIVGTSKEWKEYHREFTSLVEENKDLMDARELPRFFKELDRAGTASVESDGSVWMEIAANGETLRVGVSANNAMAAGSDEQMTYKLALARTGSELKSAKHRRETMAEFRQDWDALRRVSAEVKTVPAGNVALARSAASGLAPAAP
jgi:hypothetical protein